GSVLSVFQMPPPRGLDDGIQIGVARLPAEFPLDTLRGGDETGGVARSPRGERHPDLPSGDAEAGVDDFVYGEAAAVAEIEGLVPLAPSERVEGQKMRLREVGHVDVVPDAGPVGGVVVVSEDGDAL